MIVYSDVEKLSTKIIMMDHSTIIFELNKKYTGPQ